LAWKIASKFDLTSLEATIDKGLLKIEIPISQESMPKKIQIKPRKLLQVKS
jgi:HSP20 family molecular chaperone IbpA